MPFTSGIYCVLATATHLYLPKPDSLALWANYIPRGLFQFELWKPTHSQAKIFHCWLLAFVNVWYIFVSVTCSGWGGTLSLAHHKHKGAQPDFTPVSEILVEHLWNWCKNWTRRTVYLLHCRRSIFFLPLPFSGMWSYDVVEQTPLWLWARLNRGRQISIRKMDFSS